MKTRLLFATMVLPALFAACTNDEIVDSQSPSLDGRALLDPNFTITVNGEADTRFSWTEDGYKWNDFTANDKFSAGLLADANAANVLTNYVFSTKDGSAYTTTSQMVEGVYMFYSYPGFEKNAKSEPVAFDLTSQVSTDLTKPADVVNAEKGQLFIAPLYQLEAETANNKLGLQFISYWSTAVIPVSNISAKPFKIARIVLRSASADFLVKGTIDPSKMNTAGLIYKYDKDKGTYVLGKNGDKDAVYDDLRVADIAAEGGQKVQELVVNCGSYELAAGKSVTAYIQVPAGVYANGMEVEVVAEVTEVVAGKNVTSLKSLVKAAEPNYKSDDKLTANDKIRFRRSKSTGIFGIAADNTPAAYKVDDLELTVADAAEGLYASTYDEVYKYVTEAAADESTANDPISIYNQGSLTVDDNMMTLISRVGTKHIQFLNPIEISSERASADLKNMQFAGGATIVKGAINFGAGVELAAGKELTIKKGATAKFASGETAITRTYKGNAIAGTINNEGTLQLNGAAITKVKNGKEAVVEIVGDQTIGGTEAANVVAAFNAPKTLKVAKDATLTLNNTADQLVIGYGQTVEVAAGGKITATAAANFVNHGTIENKGTIDAVTNANVAPGSDGTKKIAKINNNGTISSVVNKKDATNGAALIVMGSDAEITATADGSTGGEIDNTANGFIKANENGCIVYAEFSGNKTGNFVSNISGCTKVILKNGTWSEPALGSSVVTVELDGVTLAKEEDGDIALATVTTLTMKNSDSNSKLTFAAVTAADLSGSTFGKDVTFSASGMNSLKLDYATFNGSLVMSSVTSLATLDLIGATFNGALTANAALTTINVKAGKNGDQDVAATTSFGGVVTASGLTALNIAAKATMKMMNSAATIGVTQQTEVKNSGLVENRGHVIGKNTNSTGTGGDGWKFNAYEGADAD
jgi:hypothetical protein